MTNGKAVPKWRALADQLAQEIRTGRRAPGSALPQVRDLSAETGLAYQTVRNVYRALEGEGLIVSRKGQGTFVSTVPGKIRREGTGRYARAAREAAGSRGAYASEITRLGMTPASETEISRERPTPAIAELLGVSRRSSSVLVRARRMLANNTVTQIATSYFPGEIAFGTALEEKDTGQGGSISRLAELGYAQRLMSEEIEVRLPTAEESKILGVTSDRPVYEITHIGRTAEGRVVEVCVHVMPVRLWTLSYTWELDAEE